MNAPVPVLRIAVVGHTNTGKTSLLRTLTRDAEFGDVSSSPSTTRRVEGVALQVNGERIVELYDTPGLEDAGRLIETLESHREQRHRGPDQIEAFLNSPLAERPFEQEARVLKQVLDSRAALYVIDAREPVLGKYQDELDILALCARPILPVLNFTASPDARSQAWREALARVNVHAVAEFDTMIFSIDAETRLWQRLMNLLSDDSNALARLIDHRQQQAQYQAAAGLRIVAELLIEVAACARIAAKDDPAAMSLASNALQQTIQHAEQVAIEQLLGVFQFSEDDVEWLDLPIQDGQWQGDLFDPDVLALYAGSMGRGAGAGAAAGAVVDVATGGLSLGAGTVLGTLIGSGIGTGLVAGRGLIDKARGNLRLQADDATLTHLAWRQLELLRALQQRGHATTQPTQLDSKDSTDAARTVWPKRRMLSAITKARLKPSVSSLNDEHDASSSARTRLVDDLVSALNAIDST
ncbi:MAG: DUF3482 domain-containing protein [Pseudomonadota bacterium]